MYKHTYMFLMYLNTATVCSSYSDPNWLLMICRNNQSFVELQLRLKLNVFVSDSTCVLAIISMNMVHKSLFEHHLTKTTCWRHLESTLTQICIHSLIQLSKLLLVISSQLLQVII